MLRRHLETLGLVCPACRAAGRDDARLVIGDELRVETASSRGDDDLIEAVLRCPAPLCQREHPIVDGIPIVVPELGAWAGHQLDAVVRRRDLSPVMESLLGDAAGPGSGLDYDRRNASTYAHAHWGDAATDAGSNFASLARTAIDFGPTPSGLWADLGAACGRGTFELARAGAGLAVGVDLGFEMLRIGELARRTGAVEYARRRVGIVYDRQRVEVTGLPRDRVAFVCADVNQLPFADRAFAGALSLNVLDCVANPIQHLVETARVLAPAAELRLSTPYDWSAATPLPNWLGGHSQRGPQRGSSEAELRRVLAGTAGLELGLAWLDDRARVPWSLDVNERSRMQYDVHLLRLRRT